MRPAISGGFFAAQAETIPESGTRNAHASRGPVFADID